MTARGEGPCSGRDKPLRDGGAQAQALAQGLQLRLLNHSQHWQHCRFKYRWNVSPGDGSILPIAWDQIHQWDTGVLCVSCVCSLFFHIFLVVVFSNISPGTFKGNTEHRRYRDHSLKVCLFFFFFLISSSRNCRAFFLCCLAILLQT